MVGWPEIGLDNEAFVTWGWGGGERSFVRLGYCILLTRFKSSWENNLASAVESRKK